MLDKEGPEKQESGGWGENKKKKRIIWEIKEDGGKNELKKNMKK